MNFERRFYSMADLVGTKDRQGVLPCSKSYIYKLISLGKFPQPVKLGNKNVWPVEVVHDFCKSVSGLGGSYADA